MAGSITPSSMAGSITPSSAGSPAERPRNGAAADHGKQIVQEHPHDDLEAGLRQAAGDVSIPRNQAGVETEIQNEGGLETLLHEAVRKRNNKPAELNKLRRFAKIPDINGMPPLYLAIFLGYSDMAELLIKTFGSDLSYDGPNGQNVLHVAALRSEDLTRTVLQAQQSEWNSTEGWEDLRDRADDASGSTPLHFAASVGVKGVTSVLVDGDTNGLRKKAMDSNGMCPIHIAASVGAMDAILALVGEEDDYSHAAIRDNEIGRTFLHVAVENKKTDVVKLVCRKPSLANILNMKDKDGNTALHLAVQNRDESSFSHLVGNSYVELNHVNKDGYTPLDLASKIKIENFFASRKNPTEWMVRVLAHSGAYFSAGRRDMKYRIITQMDPRADHSASSTDDERTQKKKQAAKLDEKQAAKLDESVLVASALIATVTFAAAFTMPGSYKTAGQRAGTPELASRYAFKVFVIADILAFYCSVAATFSLAEYGNRDDVDPLVRRIYAQRAVRLFHVALKSVIIAFALGVSVVMWDISVVTVVIVAVATSALVLYGNEALAHDLRFMRVMYRRFGFSRAWRLCPSTSSHLDWNNWRLRSFFATLAWNIAKLFGTYIFIVLVAYVAQLKQKSGI